MIPVFFASNSTDYVYPSMAERLIAAGNSDQF
jgi:hypothetical protein